jgi:hypothetical protein
MEFCKNIKFDYKDSKDIKDNRTGPQSPLSPQGIKGYKRVQVKQDGRVLKGYQVTLDFTVLQE